MTDDELARRVRARLHEMFPEPDDARLGIATTSLVQRRPSSFARLGAVAAAVLAIAAIAIAVPLLRSAHHSTSAHPNRLAALTRNVPCPRVVEKPATRTQLRTFKPVAAMYCAETRRTFPDGDWQVRIRYGSQRNIADLQKAFETPDRRYPVPIPNNQTGALTCATGRMRLPSVIFVDGQGHHIVPETPVDTSCHDSLPEVDKAFGRQHWSAISTTRLFQTKTRAAIDKEAAIERLGCGPQWKNEFHLLGSHIKASAGGPVLSGRPDAPLHACIYTVAGTDPNGGTFVRAVSLDAAKSTELRQALTGPGPRSRCTPQQQYVMIQAGKAGPYVEVELGGCWRVIRDLPPQQFGSADRSVVRELLGIH